MNFKGYSFDPKDKVNLPEFQEVIETPDDFYVDGKKPLNFVLQDSVKTEKLSNNQTVVTVSFMAKSYKKVTKE